MQSARYVAAVASVLMLATLLPVGASEEKPSFWKLQKTLAAKKYVDLTHAFEPGIPRWPGRQKVGKRSRRNPCQRVRGDVHRSIKALA
jgi:hypothetical protein